MSLDCIMSRKEVFEYLPEEEKQTSWGNVLCIYIAIGSIEAHISLSQITVVMA